MQPLRPVGARVGRDLGDAHRLGERAGTARATQALSGFTQDALGNRMPTELRRAGWCRPQTMAQFCAPCSVANVRKLCAFFTCRSVLRP